MPTQFSGAKRSDTKELMDLPLKEVKCAKAGCCIWIAGRDLLGFLARPGPDHVYPQLAVGGRSLEEYSPSVVLLFHPDQVLVETNGPLLSRA